MIDIASRKLKASTMPQPSSEDTLKTLFAILVSASGNAINALGYILQKKAHIEIRRDIDRAHKALLAFKLEKAGYIQGKDSQSRLMEEGVATTDESIEVQTQLKNEIVRAEQFLYTSSGTWLCGFATYGLGSMMHVASLGFGPQVFFTPQ